MHLFRICEHIAGREAQFCARNRGRRQDELPDKSENWICDGFERGMEGLKKLPGRHSPCAV